MSTLPYGGRRQRIVAVGGGPGAPVSGSGAATSTATLASLTPNTAAHGTTSMAVTAVGTGFVNGASIYVDGKAVPTTYLSRTQLWTGSFKPGAAGTRQVSVRNPGQVATGTVAFTVT